MPKAYNIFNRLVERGQRRRRFKFLLPMSGRRSMELYSWFSDRSFGFVSLVDYYKMIWQFYMPLEDFAMWSFPMRMTQIRWGWERHFHFFLLWNYFTMLCLTVITFWWDFRWYYGSRKTYLAPLFFNYLTIHVTFWWARCEYHGFRKDRPTRFFFFLNYRTILNLKKNLRFETSLLTRWD